MAAITNSLTTDVAALMQSAFCNCSVQTHAERLQLSDNRRTALTKTLNVMLLAGTNQTNTRSFVEQCHQSIVEI